MNVKFIALREISQTDIWKSSIVGLKFLFQTIFFLFFTVSQTRLEFELFHHYFKFFPSFFNELLDCSLVSPIFSFDFISFVLILTVRIFFLAFYSK